MDNYSKQQLDIAQKQLEVNVASSIAALDIAHDTEKLYNLQEELKEDKERALEVKKILDSVEDREITPELAATIDNQLKHAGIEPAPTKEIEMVMGVEEFGYSLSPNDFRLTRLQGIENFLLDFFRKTKEITRHLNLLFSEAYTLFTKDIQGLEEVINNLEFRLGNMEDFSAREEINLGLKLFNTFKLDDKIAKNKNWINDTRQVKNTVSAIANIYINNNVSYLQSLYNHFGGYEGLTADKVDSKLNSMIKDLATVPFKECSYRITSRDDFKKELMNSNFKYLRSVKLMGDKYFVDTRHTKYPSSIKNISEGTRYVQDILLKEGVSFFSDNRTKDRADHPVKSLDSVDIKEIIVILRELIGDWKKVYELLDTKQIDRDEYRDIRRIIYEHEDLTKEVKDFVISSFDSLIVKNQTDLVTVGADVNRYIILLVSGLIELMELSILANTDYED